MAVVRSHHSKSLVKEAVVLDLSDLGRQAQRLREQAEQQAEAIVAEARARAQQLVEGAETRGFEQGHAAGLEQGLKQGAEQGRAEAVVQMQAELEQLHQAWRDVAGQWEQQVEHLQSEGRQAVLRLALKVAEKLVHRVAAVDPSVVEDQLGAVLAHVLRPLEVHVSIHPADRPLLEKALPGLLGEFGHLKHVKLLDDEQADRGGCVASFGQGRVDASLSTQLQRVVEALVPDAAAVRPVRMQARTLTPGDGEGQVQTPERLPGPGGES